MPGCHPGEAGSISRRDCTMAHCIILRKRSVYINDTIWNVWCNWLHNSLSRSRSGFESPTFRMKKKTDQIKDQLGLSLGTASHRLRKKIMFELVKNCKLDVCYRCGNKIENIDEFSIEHKESWLNKPNANELFFSLDNIAFSHLLCNCGAAKQKVRNKKNRHGFKGVIFDKRRKKPYQAKYWNGTKYLK